MWIRSGGRHGGFDAHENAGARSNPASKYDIGYQKRGDFIDHSMTGQIVIKDSDREWELSRQGYLKWYILENEYPETVLNDWWVFVHDIKKVSGKHRHQGGLVLFILEGRGRHGDATARSSSGKKATACCCRWIRWGASTSITIMVPSRRSGSPSFTFRRGTMSPASWCRLEINEDFQSRQRK